MAFFLYIAISTHWIGACSHCSTAFFFKNLLGPTFFKQPACLPETIDQLQTSSCRFWGLQKLDCHVGGDRHKAATPTQRRLKHKPGVQRELHVDRVQSLITGQPHVDVVQEAIANNWAAVNAVVGLGWGCTDHKIIRCGGWRRRDISVAACLAIVLQERQVWNIYIYISMSYRALGTILSRIWRTMR